MEQFKITFPRFTHAARDLPAGLVVYLVALPLCLGIALASGAPLFSGIVAGIVGGLVIGLTSGSNLSVSGPAAGLTAVVATAIISLGSFEVFLMAVLLSGVIQLGLSIARAGSIGNWIPHTVIKGMLTGIGVVIILKQIPHALGRDRDYVGDLTFLQPDKLNTFTEILASIAAPSPGAIAISIVALALILSWDSVTARIAPFLRFVPGALVAVVLGTLMNQLFSAYLPDWQLMKHDGHLVDLPVLSGITELPTLVRLPAFYAIYDPRVWMVAVTIALVGSIESLLSLEAADRLDSEKRLSDPNRELFAQGLGNALSGLLGGLPVTSVIVRTSANVYAGARTRLSTVTHGLLLLLSILLIAPLLNAIPYAVLASVLIVVGYNLASVRVFRKVFSEGWAQFVPFLVTVLGVVFIGLLWGVGLGIAVSTFWILRANRRSALIVIHDGDHVLIRFNKDMSFLHKSDLKNALRRMPNGANIIIDAKKSMYIDHDVYEVLEDFETLATQRGCTIKYYGVHDKHERL